MQDEHMHANCMHYGVEAAKFHGTINPCGYMA